MPRHLPRVHPAVPRSGRLAWGARQTARARLLVGVVSVARYNLGELTGDSSAGRQTAWCCNAPGVVPPVGTVINCAGWQHAWLPLQIVIRSAELGKLRLRKFNYHRPFLFAVTVVKAQCCQPEVPAKRRGQQRLQLACLREHSWRCCTG